MFTFFAQTRLWFIVVAVVCTSQSILFWLTPSDTQSFTALDARISHMWPYINELEFEGAANQNGRPFRWVPTQGEIRLPHFAKTGPLFVSMVVHTARPPDAESVMLTIRDERWTIQTSLQPGWRRITMLHLPSQSLLPYERMTYAIVGPSVSDSRDLGIAVTHSDVIQGKDSGINGVRWLFVCAMWLWLIPVAMIRSWSLWTVALMSTGISVACWLTFFISSYFLPNYWNLVAYLWLASAILCIAPHRRSLLAGHWAVVGVGLSAALWQLGYGWPGVVVLLLVWALSKPVPRSTPSISNHVSPNVVFVVLALAFLVAGLLRMWQLDAFPSGMFRDEARHGALAMRVLAGERMVYSPLANLPAGYFYVSALPIALFDPSAWSIRIVAAVVGTVSVVLLYWMLSAWFGAQIAVWSSVMLAVFLWHIGVSRIGFPVTMGPFLTIIAVAALIRVFTSPRNVIWAIVVGMATGSMLMVYHSARLMPLVVLMTSAFLLWQHRSSWRQYVLPLFVCAGVSLLAASPIVQYALQQPDNYMRRISSTSILSDAQLRGLPFWVAIMDNIHAYVGMLFVSGDKNPRHFNLGAPQLNLIESLAFIIGFTALWRNHRDRCWWISGWLAIGLISGILSVDAPHALRTVEVIVPVVIICATGVAYLVQSLPKRFVSASWFIFLLCVGSWSAVNYQQWQLNPETQRRFDTELTNDVRFVHALAQKRPHSEVQIYVPERLRRSDVGIYLLHTADVRVWDGSQELVNQQQHIFIRERAEENNLPPDATQILQLPDSMVNRFSMWCVGDCDDLQWISQK